MAAGGFKFFIPGQVLDENDLNDFLMQGVLVFDDAADRDSQLVVPVHGQFAWLKDVDELQFYDGTSWVEYISTVDLEYLVIAGGAGAGGSVNDGTGGGGAGGYRCNVVGEKSGGDSTPEAAFVCVPGTTFFITVGAGGAGSSGTAIGSRGGRSAFGPIVSFGGGSSRYNGAGDLGGSGGGGSGGDGISPAGGPVLGAPLPEGRAGGAGLSSRDGGGGGGAFAAGSNAGSLVGGAGGDGLSSSITGTAVTRAGGGGGGSRSGTPGAGGAGGGGNGAINATGGAGTANTGGGGGGTGGAASGGAGGSGIVIFRVPTGTPVSFSGGVTHTTETVSDKTAYIVTAAGPTDTVTIG